MFPTAASFSNHQPRVTGPTHDPLFAVIEGALEPFLRDARDRDRALPGFAVEAFLGYLRWCPDATST